MPALLSRIDRGIGEHQRTHHRAVSHQKNAGETM
jgi:hypothetical protein